MNYLQKHSKTIGTPPQSMPLDSKQVPNSAGGYSYTVDPWKQLERFLVLGTEGGSYYAGEHELTFENVACLDACLKADGAKTVNLIVQTSDEGRASKNDPALFALAYAISKGDLATKRLAADALPKVARISTHLFHFATYAQDMRGWGRVLKHAIGDWYKNLPAERLADQAIKYRQRDGWTHRDLLRLAKPIGITGEASAIVDFIKADGSGKPLSDEAQKKLPARVLAHIALQLTEDAKTAAKLIRDNRLTWESVPTTLLNFPVVWEALLEHMPMTAMIRNLGKMSAIEVLKPLSAQTKAVTAVLRDEMLLKKARVHPVTVLNALRTYQQGHGEKGKLSWKPVPQIVDALDDAFYLAFQAIESTGKNFYLGLDISGSMSMGHAGGTALTPREASVVMAMVSARKEPNYYLMGFDTVLHDMSRAVTAKTSLKDAMTTFEREHWGGGGTDCAKPMLDAIERKLDVDVFCVYTDSETWFGKVHPMQALREYRQKIGHDAKLVVVGMLANKFTIADPNDMGALDVCGFDTATPQLISQFAL